MTRKLAFSSTQTRMLVRSMVLVRTLSQATRASQASRNLASCLLTPARQRCCHHLPIITSHTCSSSSQLTNVRHFSLKSLQLRSTQQDGPPPSGHKDGPEHEFAPEEHDDPEMTIYQGILSTQIKLVKSFSLMTSVIGLGCQPLIYLKVSAAGSASLPVVVAGGAFLSFFTFATPLLIHWVSKKYVTEMLYNRIENTYTAITYTFLLRRKRITFKPSDVQVIPGMFTTFQVNGKSLFVDAESFHSAQHYGKLMGYDKPLDIRFKYDREDVEYGWNNADAEEKAEKSKKKSTE